MQSIPCAGIILMCNGSVAVVRTPAGNHSFPKGKRERGEDYFTAALRELKEETGISADQIQVNLELPVQDKAGVFLMKTGGTIIEISDRGNFAVFYFFATTEQQWKMQPEDPTELSAACWVNITELKNLQAHSSRINFFCSVAEMLAVKDYVAPLKK